MKTLTICGLALSLMGSSVAADDSLMKELAPMGKFRVALVYAPSPGAFFVFKEAEGKARGVTADIAEALGQKLKLPIEYALFPNSGLATDATETGAVDVSFMPVDEERKRRVAFGPNYVQGESTYMVTGAT